MDRGDPLRDSVLFLALLERLLPAHVLRVPKANIGRILARTRGQGAHDCHGSHVAAGTFWQPHLGANPPIQ